MTGLLDDFGAGTRAALRGVNMMRHDRLLVRVIERRAAAERRIARLRRTIAAELPLLGHPAFAVGAAHVIADARTEIRSIERQRPG